ncbi:DNA replication and repair protein RecO [Gemmobacter caeni]|uniref:DNA repair protein RecO n=1 Tax=Gemmobacter caeni TaxID=589035 RepID=A0A2T6B679_9RHOB|nr:DNA repair protein RecO [Gemmobacter caeni]PTX51542.1 DNA replication and repair protein RecO [Gemmobacter caeni]TWJ03670.1 DNA replication and repair protein RecO [Gemmobacter caeni]
MEWQDEGTLIGSRPHGETSAIIEVFTAQHGRHAGVLRGGASRKVAAMLQPGSQVTVNWRARLDDHLGVFQAEPLRSRAGLMGDRMALAGLNAICAMLRFALPERAAYPLLYGRTQDLLSRLDGAGWAADYLRWEMLLLEETGFGLDLARCAVTGSREDLAYVSPRTGRAVSRGGAGDWTPRLLPLPQGLLGQGAMSGTELAQGFAITGHFLLRELSALHHGRQLPEARARLIDLLARESS